MPAPKDTLIHPGFGQFGGLGAVLLGRRLWPQMNKKTKGKKIISAG